MFSHFLRGYFDGDGWFTKRIIKLKVGKQTVIHWGLCSYNKSVILKIQNKLKEELGVVGSVNKEKSVWRLVYSSKEQVNLICDYMYKDATVFLTRKHEIAKMVPECNKKISRAFNVPKEQLLEAFNRLGTLTKVAQEFNCNRITVSKYMKSFGYRWDNHLRAVISDAA